MLRPGQRVRSQVCPAEYIVVRPPDRAVELTAGGHPVIDPADVPTEGLVGESTLMAGSPLGKRYVEPVSGLEVLVTKAGDATLAAAGRPLDLKAANPLPSSD